MASLADKNVPRQVIDNQLLIALNDNNKVAVVLEEEDLVVLIQALACDPRTSGGPGAPLLVDMKQLLKSAFRRTL